MLQIINASRGTLADMNIKLFLTIVLSLLLACPAAAQKWYRNSMEGSIAAIDTARSVKELEASERIFERVGTTSPADWLPVYYQSLTNIRKCNFMAKTGDKAAHSAINKALHLATISDSLGDNSETKVLLAYALLMQLKLDSSLAGKNLSAVDSLVWIASNAEPVNPRLALVQAISFRYFYADKERKMMTLDALNNALNLLRTHKPASSIHPAWGRREINEMLESLK